MYKSRFYDQDDGLLREITSLIVSLINGWSFNDEEKATRPSRLLLRWPGVARKHSKASDLDLFPRDGRIAK